MLTLRFFRTGGMAMMRMMGGGPDDMTGHDDTGIGHGRRHEQTGHASDADQAGDGMAGHDHQVMEHGGHQDHHHGH